MPKINILKPIKNKELCRIKDVSDVIIENNRNIIERNIILSVIT